MKSLLLAMLSMFSWSLGISQNPTIKNYLDWTYAKYEEAFDASDVAVSEIGKWYNCSSESCRNSALVIAESATDQILYSLKDAISYLKEAERLANKKCPTSNSIFKSATKSLESALYQYGNAAKKLTGALENTSRSLTQKQQVELAKAAITGSLGGEDHMKKYIKEVNIHLKEMLNCQ